MLSKLPLTTPDEFNAAVQAAKDAYPAWRDTPVPTRARVMLKFQQLIRENWVRMSANIWVGGTDGKGVQLLLACCWYLSCQVSGQHDGCTTSA